MASERVIVVNSPQVIQPHAVRAHAAQVVEPARVYFIPNEPVYVVNADPNVYAPATPRVMLVQPGQQVLLHTMPVVTSQPGAAGWHIVALVLALEMFVILGLLSILLWHALPDILPWAF